jgi:hypothetical protein
MADPVALPDRGGSSDRSAVAGTNALLQIRLIIEFS